MTDLRKAACMARAAIKSALDESFKLIRNGQMVYSQGALHDALVELNTALAQHNDYLKNALEEEWRNGYRIGKQDALCLDNSEKFTSEVNYCKKFKQEPVLWFVQYKDRHEFVWGTKPGFLSDQVLEVEPLYTRPVDDVSTSQECVDETAKRGHEPVAWIEKDVLPLTHIIKAVVRRERDEQYNTPLYATPPKREWAGLSVSKAEDLLGEFENDPLEMLFALEEHLREKNTSAQPDPGEKRYTPQDMIDVVDAVAGACKREWVGLTDEEIYKILNSKTNDAIKIVKTIEAKLKEKNT